MELDQGRMLIHFDSRKPLVFSRKVTTSGGEVTIQISYDLLFKHCSTCGLLSHEKEYCPSMENIQNAQGERIGVFDRVQVPQEDSGHHAITHHRRYLDNARWDGGSFEKRTQGHDARIGVFDHVQVPEPSEDRYAYRKSQFKGSHHENRPYAYNRENRRNDERWNSYSDVSRCSDRVMRRRDEPRYAATRHAPYGHKPELTWREKQQQKTRTNGDSQSRGMMSSAHATKENRGSHESVITSMIGRGDDLPVQESHTLVPSEHSHQSGVIFQTRSERNRSEGNRVEVSDPDCRVQLSLLHMAYARRKKM